MIIKDIVFLSDVQWYYASIQILFIVCNSFNACGINPNYYSQYHKHEKTNKHIRYPEER